MVVLGQAVGGADDFELAVRRGVLVRLGGEFLDHRVVRLLWMERILDRALDRLVVLRERSVREGGERREDAAHPLRVHDERPHVLLRRGVHLEVRNVVADPLLRGLAPPDLPPFGIPRLAGGIAGGTVVKHAAVGRPGPRPALMDTLARRVLRPTPRRLVSGFGPGTAIQPVAAGGGAVVLEPGEAGKLLAGLDLLLRLRVLEIGQGLAVDLLGELGQRWMQRIGVGPGEVQDRVGELAALLLVQLPHLQEDLRHDVLVQPRLPRRRQGHVFPLQPARGVGHRPVLLGEPRAGQAIDRGVDLLHLVLADTRRHPELAGLVRIDLAHDEEVAFLQGLDVLL